MTVSQSEDHALKICLDAQFKYMSFMNQHHLINRFNVAVRLFSNGSQMTSKCARGKNRKWHTRRQPSVSLMFSLWNLFHEIETNNTKFCLF